MGRFKRKFGLAHFSIRRAFTALSVACLMSAATEAEDFKIGKLKDVKFSEVTESVTFKAGINDAIHINLPEDMTYVCGIEINMKIPEEIAAWKNSVAYSLYDDVKPKPSEKKTEYSGKRISYATIPGRLSLNIYIPLTSAFSIKDSPYSEKIPVSHKENKKDLFFRLQLAMEQMPETFGDAQLEVTVKAVLIDKGKLNFLVEPAKQLNLPTLTKAGEQQKKQQKKSKKGEKPEFTVFIDDKEIHETGEMLLPTGEHHVSIVSESYRNELRTFVIEQAKTTNLSVELRSIEPTLIFICPMNTEICFDDKQIDNPKTAFIIEPGEHSVKMTVGDYEIVKNFTAINGRSYTMSLDIAASIYEEK